MSYARIPLWLVFVALYAITATATTTSSSAAAAPSGRRFRWFPQQQQQQQQQPNKQVISTTTKKSTDRAGEGDRDTIYLIHETLHQEAQTLAQLIPSSNEHNDVQTLWKWHHQHMQAHLQATESVFWPKLAKHINNLSWPTTQAKQSHATIQEHLQSLHKIMMMQGEQQHRHAPLSHYHHAWEQYTQDLYNHFVLQQTTMVQPARQAMTQFQWGWALQKYMEQGGVDLGSFIHHLGESTFRQEWMKACKLPQILWKVHFAKAYAKFQSQWTEPLERIMQQG